MGVRTGGRTVFDTIDLSASSDERDDSKDVEADRCRRGSIGSNPLCAGEVLLHDSSGQDRVADACPAPLQINEIVPGEEGRIEETALRLGRPCHLRWALSEAVYTNFQFLT